MNKYCRLCWNSTNWQRPTGEASKLKTKGTFIEKNSFGFEEWLFRFDWILSGYNGDKSKYRYGFIQPMDKDRKSKVRKLFTVLLFTRNEAKDILIVAKIDNLYVPDNVEVKWATKKTKRRGWFAAMCRELIAENINEEPKGVFDKEPRFINVRFRPEDVKCYYPRPIVIGDHKIKRNLRYIALDWNDPFPPIDRKLEVGDCYKINREILRI